MKCPFCGFKRSKAAQNPHWQCPNCERAYNKFPYQQRATATSFINSENNNEKLKNVVDHALANSKSLITIVITIFFFFWGIQELLIEGVYYVSQYYQQYQIYLGNDWFVFGVILLLLLFLIAIVVFIVHKIFRLLAWF
ncbi:hypothetical protein [Thalassotalea ganghwensis]